MDQTLAQILSYLYQLQTENERLKADLAEASKNIVDGIHVKDAPLGPVA